MAVLLLLSLALNVWMGAVIARLENYHYASFIGWCDEFKASEGLAMLMKREECLATKQTRSNPLWHIYYALRG